MLGRLFTFAATLSLLLCACATAFWVRGWHVGDAYVVRRDDGSFDRLESSAGALRWTRAEPLRQRVVQPADRPGWATRPPGPMDTKAVLFGDDGQFGPVRWRHASAAQTATGDMTALGLHDQLVLLWPGGAPKAGTPEDVDLLPPPMRCGTYVPAPPGTVRHTVVDDIRDMVDQRNRALTKSSVVAPTWLATAAFGLLPAAWLAMRATPRWVRRRARRSGRCDRCGYDLRASAGRCPECGSIPAESRRSRRKRQNALTPGAVPPGLEPALKAE